MRLLPLVGLALLCSPPAAAEIRLYDLHLRLAADGTGEGSARIEIAGAAAGSVEIPLGFATVRDLRLTAGPSGATIAGEPRNNQTLLRVALPEGAAESLVLGFQFGIPEALPRPSARATTIGSRGPASSLFRHALLNSQPATIDRYRFSVVFPEGMRGHAIREALPPSRRGETDPRARLENIDGRPGASLQTAALAQGELAVVQIELASRSRSAVWLLAGAGLAFLYLVRFRDLFARAR